MDDQAEPAVREGPQVLHVPLDRIDLEAFAIGHQTVLGELPGAVVEDGNLRPRRREDRALLAAAARQAEDVKPRKRGNQSRGTGFVGVRIIVQSPRRARSTSSGPTGRVQTLPSSTWRSQAWRL